MVLVYFGFFVLPFTYLASYLFSIPSSGFSRMMLLGAIAGKFQQPENVASISQFLF
jgi:hypothetical protein